MSSLRSSSDIRGSPLEYSNTHEVCREAAEKAASLFDRI